MVQTKPSTAPRASAARRVSAWWLLAGAVLLVVVVAVVVTVVTRGNGDPQAESAHLEHVHGLGIDPDGGSLYAGSHYGLYRVTPDAGVEGPIAGRVQDFMGFTVIGPGHFLASGHPGEGQDGPSSLGLLESTDAGQTWTSVSLAGEADFHALTVQGDTVYGVNALTGELLASTDMQTWETRSTIPIADIAASLAAADTLLATTEDGPALSTDGGRSFTLVDNAPLLVLVAWHQDGTVVGVDPSGVVYVGNDPSSLTERGTVDAAPEALALDGADADTIYVAAGGRILSSTDGGRTFAEYPGG